MEWNQVIRRDYRYLLFNVMIPIGWEGLAVLAL
jgi:hypothetical protein